jgi:hypothetical protein
MYEVQIDALELDRSGECYSGKLSFKPFHINDGTHVAAIYPAELDLVATALTAFQQSLQNGLLNRAETLVAREFLETANASRAASDDLSLAAFQRHLTLVRLVITATEWHFTYYDGGACGNHWLTLELNPNGEVVDFNMMG